jgi:hypothetical protein
VLAHHTYPVLARRFLQVLRMSATPPGAELRDEARGGGLVGGAALRAPRGAATATAPPAPRLQQMLQERAAGACAGSSPAWAGRALASAACSRWAAARAATSSGSWTWASARRTWPASSSCPSASRQRAARCRPR